MSKRSTPRPAAGGSQSKTAVQAHVRQMLQLERLCARFPWVAGRLRARSAGRPPLVVEDDDDLRDLLHALLLLEHADIQLETWQPPYASGARQDFRLTFEQVVLTARLARGDFQLAELAGQLAADAQRYCQRPDCRTLVCFVYDPDGRVADPRAWEHELSGEREGLMVRVFVAGK